MFEINSKTILQNIRRIKRKLRPNVLFCAVVKANAYSLGDREISTLISPHVDMFAVARINEIVRLRKCGISKPILLLGVCEDIKTAAENDAILTITSLPEARKIAEFSLTKSVSVHLAVNTGMNRFGLASVMQLRATLLLLEKYPTVQIRGIYSHFSHEIHTPHGMSVVKAQLKRFAPMRALFKRFCPTGIVHFACSGSMEFPPAQFDMVRVGKAMYGGYYGYKTAVNLTAKIISTRQISRGEIVGYGGLFTASDTMQIGVVNCGYADSLLLVLANPKSVIVEGKQCPILGKICMDNFMIDISKIENALGKTVTILSPAAQNLMEHADNCGKSAAQLLCGIV